MSQRASIQERLRRGAITLRTRLEDVLLGLRDLPAGIERAPLARILDRAIALCSTLSELDVEDERCFPTLDTLGGAAREAEAAFEALGGAADGPGSAAAGTTPVRRARDRLAAVAEGVRRLREGSIDALVALQDCGLHAARVAAVSVAAPFRASVGFPASQAVLRAPPRALIDLGPPTGPGAMDGLNVPAEDEPPPAPPSPDDERLVDHARALARDCLTDIASLGGLRVPLPESPWTHGEPFEQRLLHSLDALLALAFPPHGLPDAFNVFEEVQRYARQSPIVDPARERARALTLACTRGEHALRAVVLTLKQAHPSTFGAYGEALSLARHERTAPVMRELVLRDPDPRCVTVAIDVLRFLREARIADLVPLSAHPDARVRLAALRALGFVPERAVAADVLVDALADEEDPRVSLEIAGSLLRLGRAEGLSWVRARTDGEPPADRDLRVGHLALLAAAGGSDDAVRFVRFSSGLTRRDAALAGLFGHPALVPHLIEILTSAHWARHASSSWAHPAEIAAAVALDRITGGLHDAPREPGGPRRPSLSGERWAAWWREHEGDFATHEKLRWGRPYSPIDTVRELLSPGPAEIRADLALELAIVSGDSAFEPEDWVARQRAVLADAERRLGDSELPPGTFLEAWLRGPQAPPA